MNTMRSFKNGTFKTDKTGTMPMRNSMRVPLFNNPMPHMMKTQNMERLYCKLIEKRHKLFYFTDI